MGARTCWVLIAAIAGLASCNQYDFGREAKNRKYVDSWRDAMYIPEPHVRLAKPGVVARWQFYARRSGTIYLQVWRPVSREARPARWILIGQQKYYVSRAGPHTVYATSKIQVRSGDTLGFYFPSSSIIPFDGRECSLDRGLYVKSPKMVVPGKIFYFRRKQTGWNPCRQYSIKVTVLLPLTTSTGEAPTKRKDLDRWRNAMFIVNPKDPITVNGELTKWSFYVERKAKIYLQVWRRAGFGYRLVGQTEYTGRSYGMKNYYLTSSKAIKVQKGDLLGFYFPGSSVIPFDGRECYTQRTLYVKDPRDVKVGKVFIFRKKQTGWNPCRKYSVQATVTYYKLSTILGSTGSPPTEGNGGGARNG